MHFLRYSIVVLLCAFAHVQSTSTVSLCNGDYNATTTTFINAPLITASKSCECIENASQQTVEITCELHVGLNEMKSIYHVPAYVQALSWNYWSFVPSLIDGSGLKRYDLTYNNIVSIEDNSFENLTNLIELNLSHNNINVIQPKAFNKLKEIRKINLSHNQLNALPNDLFLSTPLLEVLILSNNNELGRLFTSDYNVKKSLGIDKSLRRLEINSANLVNLNLNDFDNLLELFLRYNHFNETAKQFHWPQTIQMIDLTGNPFNEIPSFFFGNSSALREIFLRQMPYLVTIRQNAFADLKNLLLIDLSGSKRLEYIDGNAFGNAENVKNLERFMLKNTNIKTFDGNFKPVFARLKRLDLFGAPLECDCHLRWIKDINLDTFGRCTSPSEVENILLSRLAKQQLGCRSWPGYVYTFLHGFMLICLIALFCIPIWLIVVYINRVSGNPHKVASTSPYAWTIIDSNRAEDNYF